MPPETSLTSGLAGFDYLARAKVLLPVTLVGQQVNQRRSRELRGDRRAQRRKPNRSRRVGPEREESGRAGDSATLPPDHRQATRQPEGTPPKRRLRLIALRRLSCRVPDLGLGFVPSRAVDGSQSPRGLLLRGLRQLKPNPSASPIGGIVSAFLPLWPPLRR